MKSKLLFIVTIILSSLSMNVLAANKDYRAQFINHTDLNVKVVAAPSIGDVNNGEAIPVTAHSNSAVYDVNTDGFTGGALQAAWFINGQQLTCPPALLPNKLNGQLYVFVLNSDGGQDYSCDANSSKKG